MLAVWTGGGVLAFAGAMAYAELATLRPHAGGEYVYLRDAFGRSAAFLTGLDVVRRGILRRDRRRVPSRSRPTSAAFCPRPRIRRRSSRCRCRIVPLVVSRAGDRRDRGDCRAVDRSICTARAAIVHNVLAGTKVIAITLFIAFGLSIGHGSWQHLSSVHAIDAPSTGWLLAFVPIMFTYSGWNAAAYVAEEIRDPGRNVPLALGARHGRGSS